MTTISVTGVEDMVRDIIRDMEDIQRNAIPAATSAGINAVIKSVHSQAARDLSAELGIPKKNVAARLKMKKSKVRTLSGRVIALTEPLRVSDFGKARQQRAGAKVRGKLYPGSFVATMPSGHEGVFKRKGRSRLPIKSTTVEFHGPATAKLNRLINGPFADMVFNSAFTFELQKRMNRGAK